MSKPLREVIPIRGTPIIWTEEKLIELADKLTAWSKTDSALTLAKFFTDNDLDPAQNVYFSKTSEYFGQSSEKAKRRIGIRRDEGALTKTYDSSTAARSSRMYDPDYDAFLLLKLKEEELIKANAKIQALSEQLKLEKSQGDDTLLVKVVNYAEKNL
jgi:hypothetical protein